MYDGDKDINNYELRDISLYYIKDIYKSEYKEI